MADESKTTRASVLKLGAAPSSGSRCTKVVTGTACCHPGSFNSPSSTIAAVPATLVAVIVAAPSTWANAYAANMQDNRRASTLRAITVTTLNRRFLREFGLHAWTDLIGLQGPAAFPQAGIGRGQAVARRRQPAAIGVERPPRLLDCPRRFRRGRPAEGAPDVDKVPGADDRFNLGVGVLQRRTQDLRRDLRERRPERRVWMLTPRREQIADDGVRRLERQASRPHQMVGQLG